MGIVCWSLPKPIRYPQAKQSEFHGIADEAVVVNSHADGAIYLRVTKCALGRFHLIVAP